MTDTNNDAKSRLVALRKEWQSAYERANEDELRLVSRLIRSGVPDKPTSGALSAAELGALMRRRLIRTQDPRLKGQTELAKRLESASVHEEACEAHIVDAQTAWVHFDDTSPDAGELWKRSPDGVPDGPGWVVDYHHHDDHDEVVISKATGTPDAPRGHELIRRKSWFGNPDTLARRLLAPCMNGSGNRGTRRRGRRGGRKHTRRGEPDSTVTTT